jgi:hypothetical protein
MIAHLYHYELICTQCVIVINLTHIPVTDGLILDISITTSHHDYQLHTDHTHLGQLKLYYIYLGFM